MHKFIELLKNFFLSSQKQTKGSDIFTIPANYTIFCLFIGVLEDTKYTEQSTTEFLLSFLMYK